jgi:hypothetical protein
MFGAMDKGRNGTAWGAVRARQGKAPGGQGIAALALGAAVALATAGALAAAAPPTATGLLGTTVALPRAEGRRPDSRLEAHTARIPTVAQNSPAVGAPRLAQPAAASVTGRASASGTDSHRPSAFSIDLYRRGDFVGQPTRDFCIPAAILTMTNIVEPGATHSVAAQRRLYRVARQLSTWRLVGGGAEAEGWAGALNGSGRGHYAVAVKPTREEALRAAATALRLTGRPVGLVVWRGAHAWVMSGFRATADPALTDRFAVTHVYVEDPWYPRGSSIWGTSRSPDSIVPVAALAADFLPFHRPTVRYPDKDGRFVLVLPVPRRPSARPVADVLPTVAAHTPARRLMQ